MFLLRSSYTYVARLSNVAQILCPELSDAINWAYKLFNYYTNHCTYIKFTH